MEVEVSGSKSSPIDAGSGRGRREKEQVRVKKKTLQAVLEQCQRALESLRSIDGDGDGDGDGDDVDGAEEEEEDEDLSSQCGDSETAELCDLLRSRVESPNFLEELETAQVSVPQNMAAEEGSSWDMVSENDLWEGGSIEPDQEGYVLVGQEDIVEGIASFMAAYLLSLKQTKELSPNQLQEGYIKIQHLLGPRLQPFGLLVVLYQSFSELQCYFGEVLMLGIHCVSAGALNAELSWSSTIICDINS
ncbi:hypothetical protein HHK36_030725 [Tetracentron sinense]|uniref:Uncharacterized protein n=1 Tax=Tetracentron sinense TaxID=13715 RepID=A0A834Y834_TETSI|nr:hypothetical protein HHK36_030725 [Tetracentron sinense]